MTSRDRILKAVAELPEDASIEDAMERLYLLMKIERGLAQVASGQLVSQEEAKLRMARATANGSG